MKAAMEFNYSPNRNIRCVYYPSRKGAMRSRASEDGSRECGEKRGTRCVLGRAPPPTIKVVPPSNIPHEDENGQCNRAPGGREHGQRFSRLKMWLGHRYSLNMLGSILALQTPQVSNSTHTQSGQKWPRANLNSATPIDLILHCTPGHVQAAH